MAGARLTPWGSPHGLCSRVLSIKVLTQRVLGGNCSPPWNQEMIAWRPPSPDWIKEQQPDPAGDGGETKAEGVSDERRAHTSRGMGLLFPIWRGVRALFYFISLCRKDAGLLARVQSRLKDVTQSWEGHV